MDFRRICLVRVVLTIDMDFEIKLLDTKIDCFSLLYNDMAIINIKKCNLCKDCIIF
jgi:hypothetical protein